MDYPNTFKRFPQDSMTDYPDVFDPALKQFPRAFRHGEPSFCDAAMEARWRAARQRVLDHVLRAIAESPWKENLVLRGSLLMKQWFGDAAREPGDVDWVVQPTSIKFKSSWASNLFIARKAMAGEDPVVRIDDVRVEDIWTYDRVPGRRIVYFWRTDHTPPGSVQMDFVFGEEMWMPPVRTAVTVLVDEKLAFLAATPELSLAWKLQWLDTDMYPQGKDLYDAVLLAERIRVPHELIKRALADRIRRSGNQSITAQIPLGWRVDWKSFQNEYPWIKGEASAWQARLAKALQSSFALT